jgi:hypothetical protein
MRRETVTYAGPASRTPASRRALRFRPGAAESAHKSSRRAASEAWALVSASWLFRVVVVFLLLDTLGVGNSFPLALLFLLRGAALPIG